MAKPSVTVKGLPELERALAAFEKTATDLRAPGKAAGDELAREIARRTPRRIGTLASSWRVDAGELTTRVSSDVRYAPPVESGVPRRGMLGAHMVADAADAAEPSVAELYEQALAKGADSSGLG